MMLERIIEVLKQEEGISAWKISERRIEGQELFFIRHDLDMQRSKDVLHTEVTVYHDFEEGGQRFRGSLEIQIHPTPSLEDVRTLVRMAVAAARYVRNPHFPLVKPGAEAMQIPESSFSTRPIEQWLGPLTEALFAAEDGAETRINSAELFLNRVDTRILNSNGVEAQYRSYRGYCELIAEAEGPIGEVELHKELYFSDFDPQALSAEVAEQLHFCRDRAEAGQTPQLKRCTVLITGDPVHDFFGYYLKQSSAESVYSGISTMKIGECIQGENIKGDALRLNLEPYLKNSVLSAPIDSDGLALQPALIIEEGKLKRYWGEQRFCHYLDIAPTGGIRNIAVAPGKKSAAELRQEPYLEVVHFSDFRTDPLTGDFGGEIRLAYYSEGGGRIPVSGGSVSGNLRDIQARMHLSEEVQSATGFRGPLTVRLPEVSVAGAGSIGPGT